MKTLTSACAAALAAACLSAPAFSQAPGGEGFAPRPDAPRPHHGGPGGPGGGPMMMGPGEPPFMKTLYPPEMIVKHHGALKLTDAQKASIEAITTALAASDAASPWALIEEVDALTAALEAEVVDVDAALAQAETVMTLERDRKLTHLKALIELRNVLTPEQRATLDAVREAHGERAGGEGRRPGR